MEQQQREITIKGLVSVSLADGTGGERLMGSLMAPVQAEQRMSPSSPETEGLSVGGVLCILCTIRM